MRFPSLAVLVVLTGCKSTPSSTSTDAGVAAVDAGLDAAPPEPGLRGEVIAPADASGVGRLVLTWRLATEEQSLTTLRHMIDRMKVSDADIDIAKSPRQPYDMPDAPGDAVPLAYFDREHTFWATLMGGGKGYVATGTAGGGALNLAPNPAREDAGKERCAGDRLKLVVVEDDKLGKRRFCAYLPASWTTEPKKRYPIIWLLPGYTSNEMSYLSGKRHLGERFDDIVKETKREAVLVGVDTSDAFGSTYLEDSPTTGAWDTFLAKKALPALDRELRALPGRTAHALMGQSTGGYNALSYGLRHSELFSGIGSSSPDAPDVEQWLFQPGTRKANPWMLHWAMIESRVGGAGQFTSWAASWSPDPAAPRGFKLPLDPETGAVDEPVLAQWVKKTPHGLVRDPAFVAKAKKDLSGRIMIIVGRKDDFDLFPPAESFAAELNKLGIETKFVATDHGHAGAMDRFEPTLKFLTERLDAAK